MFTCHVPKGTPYSLAKFAEIVSGMVQLLMCKHHSAVSEPMPKDPADWHFHLTLVWLNSNNNRKTIKNSLIVKLDALLGWTNTVGELTMNFGTSKDRGRDKLQKQCNDGRYAHGESKKKKKKYDVITSKGYLPWLVKKEKELKDQKTAYKKTGADTTDHKQLFMHLVMTGQDYDQIWAAAEVSCTENPSTDTFSWFHYLNTGAKRFKEIVTNYMEQKRHQTLVALHKKMVLRPWQKAYFEEFYPTRRHGRDLDVIITPPESGKSTLVLWLHYVHKWFMTTNMKNRDLSQAFRAANCPLNVCFNMTNDTPGRVYNVSGMEMLLDGMFGSPKYASQVLGFHKAHVLVCCNHMPIFDPPPFDMGGRKLPRVSADRWRIFEIVDGTLQRTYPSALKSALRKLLLPGEPIPPHLMEMMMLNQAPEFELQPLPLLPTPPFKKQKTVASIIPLEFSATLQPLMQLSSTIDS